MPIFETKYPFFSKFNRNFAVKLEFNCHTVSPLKTKPRNSVKIHGTVKFQNYRVQLKNQHVNLLQIFPHVKKPF
jgi:hypothetical protein